MITDSVLSIYQEQEGFLWFGTLEGLSQYDGVQFVNFRTHEGLAHNYVWSIHQDRDGILWIGTWDNGISLYDGEKMSTSQPTMDLHRTPYGPFFKTEKGSFGFQVQARDSANTIADLLTS